MLAGRPVPVLLNVDNPVLIARTVVAISWFSRGGYMGEEEKKKPFRRKLSIIGSQNEFFTKVWDDSYEKRFFLSSTIYLYDSDGVAISEFSRGGYMGEEEKKKPFRRFQGGGQSAVPLREAQ
ncbi:hypothetical protein NDU88_001500 [Pleurodeles waltl]|uniref:Uncharacterized protein n=1 Tax=Pleurodeles waltl TaxID=8319 RepID=A0AAV7VWL6_PLEWA|nr:hypothetical protein NDU88_001500 [Pleurodeles waltl]